MRDNNNKGIALVMTLWVLVLLTVLAMNFSFSTRYGSAGARNFKEDALAHTAALSAYESAVEYLMKDPDPGVDYVDSNGVFHTDSERDPISGTHLSDDMSVSIDITDEDSKLNLNSARSEYISAMLLYVGAPDNEVPEMLDALMDWKDPDDLHRLLGAEDEHYEPLGYKTKNSGLDLPQELLMVKGFSPEYFYGTDNMSGISTKGINELSTTWGDGININTASGEVLSFLGLSQLEVETLLKRRAESDGLRTVPGRFSGFGKTVSDTITITVSASLNRSPQMVVIKSVLKRYKTKQGIRYKTLYWKEDIESSGA